MTVARGDSAQDYLESTVYRSTGLGLTRDTRATVDQVLDPKTVEVLQKMQKQGLFDELAGCISTGKEANVYFGVKSHDSCVAVKVYKTSILGFRDRDEYVDGEFRFRHGYCKSNPRKMVALWAEKEQRNLNRLAQAGLNCPQVFRCKRNVLVMSLVGRPGKAAPRLKDVAREPMVGWTEIYLDVIRSMRRMFILCRLVHGDLSEYNMLLDESDNVFIIDVSQSVGVDHPRSLEFLKRDCLNVNLFFEKKCESVISLQDLFYFVINDQIGKPTNDNLELSESEEIILAGLLSPSPCFTGDTNRPDDSVFMQTWVPSCLAEVGDIREVEKLIEDKSRGASTVFDALIATPQLQDDSSSQSEEEFSSLSGDYSSESEDPETSGRDGHKPEGMTKQEWKKKVKEEKREQRKNKVPKHLKQKRNLKKYGKK
jgi:RIO kinase 1